MSIVENVEIYTINYYVRTFFTQEHSFRMSNGCRAETYASFAIIVT